MDPSLRWGDNKSVSGKSSGDGKTNAAPANSLFVTPTDSNAPERTPQIQAVVNPDELQKTALALWLVNSNTTDPKLEDMLNFANTEDFDQAKKAIFEELDKRDLRRVYEDIELPLIPVLKRMEDRGIKIDRKMLARLSREYHATADGLEKSIWKQAGMEFNISSPKQLGEVLFDKLGLAAKNMKKRRRALDARI